MVYRSGDVKRCSHILIFSLRAGEHAAEPFSSLPLALCAPENSPIEVMASGSWLTNLENLLC